MVLLGSVALVDVLLVALLGLDNLGLVADVPLQKDTATAEAAEGEEGTQVAPCQLAVVLEVASVVPDPAWLLVAAFGTYPFLFVELLALSPLAQVTAEVAAEHPAWAVVDCLAAWALMRLLLAVVVSSLAASALVRALAAWAVGSLAA